MASSPTRSRSRFAIRQAVNNNPLISKYFRILGADKMVPAQYRESGFIDYLTPGVELGERR